ncbi:maleylpyruvate isomerase N-terminal domain-containing protein [Nonomuraea sp. B10E15]|uniref:maleylpyruvate isomerase N-terminal domain-containing protein n=1 Tax=Nonomuraea sp. B10E15 TaxID=3153560 RepID=UPI00325F3324
MSGITTSGWDVLDASHEALREVVSAAPEGGWDLPTPCAGWSVTQVFRHAAGDQIVEPLRAWGAYAAALETEPGDDEVAVLLRYLGRDPRWAPSS